jgi:DNA-binding PadR family transcriptional regulator
MTGRDIDRDKEIDRHLPLPPAVFHILIALGEGEKHGYAVMQDVADRTGGKVRMSPGTLYGSIRKMLDEGLIEEIFLRARAAARDSASARDDVRRRYYRVTKFGRAVAAAEAARLSALLHDARVAGLVPRKG